ncbi:MAG: hypothetical protein AMXMBFR13_34620 [Phycisphaerae bacterium]
MSTIIDTLLHLLDGCTRASAVMPYGKPGPIRLPIREENRRDLIQRHISGSGATVLFAPQDKPEHPKAVDPLILGGYSPGADKLCRFIGVDLDGGNHGDGGLADPMHAGRCIASACDWYGLADGLLFARSKSARGIHVRVVPPDPVPLTDAVLALGTIIASAMRLAAADVEDGTPHAFRTVGGGIAKPGQPGAVELIPPHTEAPAVGWSMALPAAGAYRQQGGSSIISPFEGKPLLLDRVPLSSREAWSDLVRDAKRSLRRRTPPPRPSRPQRPRQRAWYEPKPHPATEALVSGRVQPGNRANAAFASACNLLGLGIAPHEVERQVVEGAVASGLPEREARAAYRSALKAKGVRS